MRVALIDTSLMLDCARRKLDVFGALGALMDGPFELIVPEGAVKELERKALERGGKGADARLALSILGAKNAKANVKIEQSEGHVDDWLFSRARETGNDAIICTNDADLRRKARKAGLAVISLLQNSRLGYA